MKKTLRKNLIKRILVITVSNIGDVVLTTPAIARLRKNFPQAHIAILVGPKAHSLLEGSATVDEVLSYDKHASLSAKINLLRFLRKKRFDLVVDFRQTIFPFLLGTKHKTPVLRWPRQSNQAYSMRDKHMRLLEPWKLDETSTNAFQFFTARDKEHVEKRLAKEGILPSQPFAVVAAGARSEVKRWRVDGFRKVCEALIQDRGVKIVLVGDKAERSVLDELARGSSETTVNLGGETTLRELAALIALSTLVIANDSAVMHLANEQGIRCVGIFGPTSDQKYGGRGKKSAVVRRSLPCTPCELAQCKKEKRSCLDDLSADEVKEAALGLLDK